MASAPVRRFRMIFLDNVRSRCTHPSVGMLFCGARGGGCFTLLRLIGPVLLIVFLGAEACSSTSGPLTDGGAGVDGEPGTHLELSALPDIPELPFSEVLGQDLLYEEATGGSLGDLHDVMGDQMAACDAQQEMKDCLTEGPDGQADVECDGTASVKVLGIYGWCSNWSLPKCDASGQVSVLDIQNSFEVDSDAQMPAYVWLELGGVDVDATYSVEMSLFPGLPLPFVVGDTLHMVLETEPEFGSTYLRLSDALDDVLMEVYSGALDTVPWPTLESTCAPTSWTVCDIPVYFKTLALCVQGLSIELEGGQMELLSADGVSFEVRSGGVGRWQMNAPTSPISQ